MPLADWSTRLHGSSHSFATLASLLLLLFPLITCTPSSSTQTSGFELDDEIVRETPLFPPLQSLESLEYTDATYELLEPIANSDADIETSIENSDATFSSDEGDEQRKINDDEVDDGDDVRKRRSSDQDNHTKTPSERIKTADTVLSMEGSARVRDGIGDAKAAPARPSASRVDALVFRTKTDRAPVAYQNVEKQETMEVEKEKKIVVRVGEAVRIKCDLNLTIVDWYRDGQRIDLPSKPSGPESAWRERERDGETLVVLRATRTHAAVWHCASSKQNAQGAPTTLLIHEPVRSVYLTVDGRRMDGGNTWVPAQEKTKLHVGCFAEGGVPAPTLSWRLEALDPTLDLRPYIQTQETNTSIAEGLTWSSALVVTSRELHNASVICRATQTQGLERDAKLQVHVTYPPSFVISRWPGFGVPLRGGSSAALRCDADANPPASIWWDKDDDNYTSSSRVRSPQAALVQWSSLNASAAGWYRCRAVWMTHHYSSIGYYLSVVPDDAQRTTTFESTSSTESTSTEDLDHQKVDVPLGGNVQLHCPKGSVGCWWRRSLGPNSTTPSLEGDNEVWTPAGSKHAHGVLGIKDALYEEGGEYRCVGANSDDVTRLKELKRVTVRVTGACVARAVSSVVVGWGRQLRCALCAEEGEVVRGVWMRGGGGDGERGALRHSHEGCYLMDIHVDHHDEMWCVAVSKSGGSVAVFPPPTLSAPALSVTGSSGATQHADIAFITIVFIAIFAYT